MSTKPPRSEGVRRIVLACSVVLAVLPLLWLLGALIGNLGDLSSSEVTFCILIAAIGCIVLFLIPRAITKLAYWIIDGFCEDKNR